MIISVRDKTMTKHIREAKQIISHLITLQSGRAVCAKLVRINLYLDDQVWQ